jgi:hypothetical protein
MSSLTLTYPDLMAETGYALMKGRDSSKWEELEPGTTAVIDSVVQSGYRQFLHPPKIDNRVHIWSHLRPVGTLSVRASVTGTLNAIPTRAGNEYIIEATTSVFTAVMVGEHIRFDDSEHEFKITEYISGTRVKAVGDTGVEFGEYPAVGLAESVEGSELGTIVTADAVFTLSMVGATLAFDGGGSYTISEFTSSTVVRVQGDASSESGAFAVGSVTGTATATTLVMKSVITATEPIFDDEHAGMTVVFDAASETHDPSFPPLGHPRYTNIEVLSDRKIKVTGNARKESGKFFVVHAASAVWLIWAPDAQGINVLEVDDSIFQSGHVGLCLLFFSSANKYVIGKYTSGTKVSLLGDVYSNEIDVVQEDLVMIVGAAAQASGDTFTIVNSGGDYDFPPEFPGNIDGRLTFSASSGYGPIEIVAEGQIRQQRALMTTATGRPKYAAIRSKGDYGKEETRHELMLHPAPDQNYTIQYPFKARAPRLSEDNPYPIFGAEYSEALLASCLDMAEQKVNGTRGAAHEQFLFLLAGAIALDRRMTDPPCLGYMGESSDASEAQTGVRHDQIPTSITIGGLVE